MMLSRKKTRPTNSASMPGRTAWKSAGLPWWLASCRPTISASGGSAHSSESALRLPSARMANPVAAATRQKRTAGSPNRRHCRQAARHKVGHHNHG